MKKKLGLLSLIIFLAFSAIAGDASIVTIEGKLEKDFVKQIKLYRAVDGEMIEWGSSHVKTDGSFVFALSDPDEGFYYVGLDQAMSFLRYRFYVKNGEAIKLEIGDESYRITGRSPQNKLLNEWQQIYSDIYFQGFAFWNDRTGYVTYFPKLATVLTRAEALKNKISNKDKAFKDFFVFLIDNDIEAATQSLLLTPRTAHPSPEERPAYLQTIVKKDKFCNTNLLKLGDGLRRLTTYTTFQFIQNPGDRENAFKNSLNSICNDTLKGYLVMNQIRGLKTPEAIEEFVAPYSQYLKTDSLQAQYTRLVYSVVSFKKGARAYQFEYPDTKGNNVSLASLKGNVVLVDTWATWCMPCKEEIPYLKKLEEELKGEKIAIVSISVDEEPDHQKWLDMVEKEKLGGIQLFAKGWSEFTKYYRITGIPRFLVFDKEGKIVTVDAPRPSNPALKELLLKTARES